MNTKLIFKSNLIGSLFDIGLLLFVIIFALILKDFKIAIYAAYFGTLIIILHYVLCVIIDLTLDRIFKNRKSRTIRYMKWGIRIESLWTLLIIFLFVLFLAYSQFLIAFIILIVGIVFFILGVIKSILVNQGLYWVRKKIHGVK